MNKFDVTKLAVLADCSDNGIVEPVCLVKKKDAMYMARALTEYYKKDFYVLSTDDGNVESFNIIVENYLDIPEE